VAYIDLKDLDTGIHNLEVEIEAPSFLKVKLKFIHQE